MTIVASFEIDYTQLLDPHGCALGYDADYPMTGKGKLRAISTDIGVGIHFDGFTTVEFRSLIPANGHRNRFFRCVPFFHSVIGSPQKYKEIG